MNKPTLLEGLRIPGKVLDAFLSKLQDEELMRMGFEVEFYSDIMGGNVVADLSEIGFHEAIRYFQDSDVDTDAMYDWFSNNEDEVFRAEGIDKDELAEEVFEEWFDDNRDWYQEYLEEEGDFDKWFENNPDWYKKYLEEQGEWDEEEDEPADDATDEDDAMEAVKEWLMLNPGDHDLVDEEDAKGFVKVQIQDDEKSFGRYEDFDSKLREKTDEAMQYVDIREYWWKDDHWDVIRSSNWELDYEYSHSEDDEDVIIEGGSGGIDQIIDMLDGIVEDRVNGEGYGDADAWEVKPDGSLSEGGVEIASPVFDFMTGVDEMEKIFRFMEDNGFRTDEDTGLHVSISFTEPKEIDEIDWVKVALLSGEEYMLDQFGRLGNNYTPSQLKRLESMAKDGKLGDLSQSRTFQDLKADFAKGVSSDKYSSFNIGDFRRGGRVEWRIMGGHDYHTEFKTVKDNSIKMAFAMYIGADEEAFKKQYLRALGRLLSRVRKTQDDPLERKKNLLYGDDETASILSKNPLYPKAVQIFKKEPREIAVYQAVTIKGERTMDPDATGDERRGFNYIMGNLASIVVTAENEDYENLFAIRATLGDAVPAFGESILREAFTENPTTARKKKLVRATAHRYGFNNEDFYDNTRKDAVQMLKEHYPIADHIAGLSTHSTASCFFSDFDELHNQRKQEFLPLVPALKRFAPHSRAALINVIAFSVKETHKEAIPKEIGNAIVQEMRAHESDGQYTVPPENKQFILDFMKKFGVIPDQVVAGVYNQQIVASFFGSEAEGLTKEIEFVLNRAGDMVGQVMPADSAIRIARGLMHDNSEERLQAANVAAIWYARMWEKDVAGKGVSKEARRGALDFLNDFKLIKYWVEADLFSKPIGSDLANAIHTLNPVLMDQIPTDRNPRIQQGVTLTPGQAQPAF